MRMLFGSVVSLSLCGCLGTAFGVDLTSWKHPSEFDADITERVLPSVVAVSTGWGRSAFCTGAVISKRAVITAAHCVDLPAVTMNITYACADVRSIQCRIVNAETVEREPHYRFNFQSGNDIAVVIANRDLEGTVPLRIATNAMAREMGVIDGPTELVFAGYGFRNDRYGVLNFGLGTQVDDYVFEFTTQQSSGVADPRPGDSGGPALIIHPETGEPYLWGVLSRAILRSREDKVVGVGMTTYTKAYAYADWIRSVVRAHE